MDEHYIDFTALVGPIGEPHKLHTFDADGNVNRTVHGDLAERLANAVWDVDHDADISTHITTEGEMQARADAVEEQDWLRAVVTKLEAERDRLRAIVEADDGPVAKTMEYLGQVEAERDHERGLRQGLDRLANTLFEERNEARAERDRLRTWIAEAANATEATVFELLAERDRLRAVVEHAVEVLGKAKVPPAGLLSVVSLMRLALDVGAEATDG